MNFIITFIILSLINVVFSTIRSLTTIKSGKTIASLVSGGYFAFYNVVLIYSVADFSMWQKCLITFVCNVIGVYVVKLIEEKLRKDRLWKIECTFDKEFLNVVKDILIEYKIPFNYIDIDKYVIFNIYCATQTDSTKVKDIIYTFNGKYFASETKLL